MSLLAAALVLLLQIDPSGTPEQLLLYKLAKAYGSPSGLDPSVEAMGLASPRFATRYIASLLLIQQCYESGRGFESAYNALLKLPGSGSPGNIEHLRALASSFKAAVRCKECNNGKVSCSKCLGKGRIDNPCSVCGGAGRIRPAGAVGSTDLSVKCRNCEGIGVFRNVGCGVCGRSGLVACSTCKGKPWPEARCDNPGCKDGRSRCPTCQGTGQEIVRCPYCQGGRVRAPGAASPDVTMKCRNCEVDGQHGNGTFRQDCRTCKKTGWVSCEQCGGLLGKKKAVTTAGSLSDVYGAERCDDCGGKGWPEPEHATPCAACLGLGIRVKPASDPSKTLEGAKH
jgi:hypothetical protein